MMSKESALTLGVLDSKTTVDRAGCILRWRVLP